jgi:hypothetical protein
MKSASAEKQEKYCATEPEPKWLTNALAAFLTLSMEFIDFLSCIDDRYG